MRLWQRVVGERPIVTRLVLTVAVAMTVVLVLGSAFVFWRVDHALSRQLDRDLDAYREVAESAIENGRTLVSDTPGQRYQLYAASGAVAGGTVTGSPRLIPADLVRDVARHGARTGEVGHLFGSGAQPYRYVATPIETPDGQRVVAFAISRAERDEALRELLLQLAVVGFLTLVASSYVGYRTARGALDPVERFRVVAAGAGERDRLPVGDHDDELNRLGATFNALLDRVQASAERERRFISDAAHELRAPLTVMRADVDWALLRAARSAEDAQIVESLTSVRAQVERLAALCNMLLQLEELRATGPAVPESVAVDDLLTGAADRWRDRVGEQGRQVAVVLADPARLDAHTHWLEVALDNLIGNALRYGAGTVTLATATTGTEVVVSVRDEGAGFPDEFVECAFDRFARADDSRASGGTGLGLAIVAAAVQLHGGRVDIAGAEVTLHLPSMAEPRRAGG